jgi:hypothetical protein
MTGTTPFPVTKLIPFNPHRFDACMSVSNPLGDIKCNATGPKQVSTAQLACFWSVDLELDDKIHQGLVDADRLFGKITRPMAVGEPAPFACDHLRDRAI